MAVCGLFGCNGFAIGFTFPIGDEGFAGFAHRRYGQTLSLDLLVDEQDSGQSLLDRLGFIGTAGVQDLARLAENRRFGHSGWTRRGKVLEAAGLSNGDLASQKNQLVRVEGFDCEIFERPGLGFQFILQPDGIGTIGSIRLITDTKRGRHDFECWPVLGAVWK